MRNYRSRLYSFDGIVVAAFVLIFNSFPSYAQQPYAQQQEQQPNDPWFGQPDWMICNQAALDCNTLQRFKPVFGIDVGAIWLSRQTPNSQNLVFDQNSNVLLNANQLKGSSGVGLDTTLSFFNIFRERPIDFQMRFFQASDMSAEQTLTATQVVPLFYGAVPVNPTNSNSLLYETQMRSFEANIVYRTPFRIRLLTGFRFFEVDEIYDVVDNVSSSSSTRVGFFSRAENTMAGGQIGAEGTLLSNDNGRVFGSCKWAMLSNDSFGVAQAANSSGVPIESVASEWLTSQLLDFQLGGSLGLSRCFSIYAGYQGLVASDLGLALQQNRNASVFAGSNPIFTSDSQWHGFKLSLVGIW